MADDKADISNTFGLKRKGSSLLISSEESVLKKQKLEEEEEEGTSSRLKEEKSLLAVSLNALHCDGPNKLISPSHTFLHPSPEDDYVVYKELWNPNPLMIAVMRPLVSKDVIKRYLTQYNINSLDMKGNSPLHYVIRASRGSTINQLISEHITLCNAAVLEALANNTLNTFIRNDTERSTLWSSLLRGRPKPVRLVYSDVYNRNTYMLVISNVCLCEKLVQNCSENLSPNHMFDLVICSNPKSTRKDLKRSWPRLLNKLTIKYLINQGANINLRNEDGHTPLWEAVVRDNKSAAKVLLDAGADINLPDKHGKTVLMKACENPGSSYLLKLLLEHSADIHLRDNQGLTALFYAIKSKHVTAVQSLLDAGANANEKYINSSFQTPLDAAVNFYLRLPKFLNTLTIEQTYGDNQNANDMFWPDRACDIINVLVNNEAEVCPYIDGQCYNEILLSVLSSQNIEVFSAIFEGPKKFRNNDYSFEEAVAKLLCENKKIPKSTMQTIFDFINIDIDSLEPMEEPLLMSAVREQNISFCQIMVSNGANVNITNTYGDSVLTVAIKLCRFWAVKLLLEAGANVNIESGSTLLPIASLFDGVRDVCLNELCEHCELSADTKHRVSIMKFLLENGYDVNIADSNGETAILDAIYQHNFIALDFYIQYKADLKYIDERGKTYLHYINKFNRTDHESEVLKFVRNCLDSGIDINHKDNDGNTALINACYKMSTNIVSDLLEYGAAVNCQNNIGQTPLMAAYLDNHDVLNLLLDYSANVNLQDFDELSVLMKICRDNIYKYEPSLISRIIANSDKNLQTIQSKTALTYFLKCGVKRLADKDIAKYLSMFFNVGFKFSPTICRKTLYYAIHKNYTETIKILIRNGAYPYDVESTTLLKKTSSDYHEFNSLLRISPLRAAIFYGNGDIAKLFFQNRFLTRSDLLYVPHLTKFWLFRNAAQECSDVYKNDELQSFLKELSQPFKLLCLAFVAFSSHLGEEPRRNTLLSELSIPPVVLDELTFKNI